MNNGARNFSSPPLRLHHRAGPGAESWHLLLPQMPAFRPRASDIKAGSVWTCTSDQDNVNSFAAQVFGIKHKSLLTNHGVVSIIYVDVVSITSGEEMAYIRVQKRGKRRYYYLVKSEREGNKVRQKVLQYLGTSRPSKEDLDTIMDGIRNKRGGYRL
jgi:hypothetical protein